jgi:hypothetical protein
MCIVSLHPHNEPVEVGITVTPFIEGETESSDEGFGSPNPVASTTL